MMVNMSRHCDFIASTVKFIYAETNQENSTTLKVYMLKTHIYIQTFLECNFVLKKKGIFKYLPEYKK